MKIKNAIGSQVDINNDTRNQRFFVSFCPSTSSAIGFEDKLSILTTRLLSQLLPAVFQLVAAKQSR